MSFGWLTKFRKGAWISLRTFILNERRDIAKRIAVIDNEVRKLGHIIVIYATEDDDSGKTRVTEERKGIYVSENTLLEKLLQAYVVSGGNILDISHFFVPDLAIPNSEDISNTIKNFYPYGGVLYPLSANYEDPADGFGQYTGGFLPIRKYLPLRIGGRQDVEAEALPFLNLIHYSRDWVKQEIKEKRNDMEARIIKICDLREQLLEEKFTLLQQAFGGLVPSLGTFNADRFQESLRVPNIVNYIDNIFFNRDEEDNIDFESYNEEKTQEFRNIFDDIMPDEKNTAI